MTDPDALPERVQPDPTDDQLLEQWRKVQGPRALLTGPLIRYGVNLYRLGLSVGREQAIAERNRAIDALIKYGKHEADCLAEGEGVQAYVSCTCGFSSSLIPRSLTHD